MWRGKHELGIEFAEPFPTLAGAPKRRSDDSLIETIRLKGRRVEGGYLVRGLLPFCGTAS